MHDHDFVKKMAILTVVMFLVLGFFFYQQLQIVNPSGIRPSPTPIISSTGNIIVTAPLHNMNVPPQIGIQGKAKVHNNTVFIKVSNKVIGTVYYSGFAETQAPDPDGFGAFASQIKLDTKDATLFPNDELQLEVFQVDPNTQKETDKVTIPLYFTPNLP